MSTRSSPSHLESSDSERIMRRRFEKPMKTADKAQDLSLLVEAARAQADKRLGDAIALVELLSDSSKATGERLIRAHAHDSDLDLRFIRVLAGVD